MSKADRLKEEIGWLKVTYAILAAVDISLIAWMAQNYTTASAVLLGLGTIVITLVTAAIVWVTKIAYRRFDELERL